MLHRNTNFNLKKEVKEGETESNIPIGAVDVLGSACVFPTDMSDGNEVVVGRRLKEVLEELLKESSDSKNFFFDKFEMRARALAWTEVEFGAKLKEMIGEVV